MAAKRIPRITELERGDPALRAAARTVARSRSSHRWLFAKDERLDAVFSDLRPEMSMVAVSRKTGRPLGVLLMRQGSWDPYHISLRKFRRHWGWGGGTVRYVVYHVLEGLPAIGSNHLVAFWVSPRCRGEGLGGRMLDEFVARVDGHLTLLARRGREDFYIRHGFRRGGGVILRAMARVSGRTAMTT